MTSHKHYVGGGASAPIGPRTSPGRPDNPYFADLMAAPFRHWVTAVAENFVWLAAQPHSLHAVSECWIDAELAMCVRYSNPAGRFGARFARLHESPISGPLHPSLRVNDSGSAVQQASNILDVRLGPGPVDQWDWTEPDGCRWWGDEPLTGWPNVNDPASRIVTISPPAPA